MKTIEESTPNPQPVVITGIVEELKFSKAKVTFIPDRGSAITGFLAETVEAREMAKYWGQKVTIRGTAHFKSNGQMNFVEIEKVSLASEGDAYFSHPVRRETVAQQLERQMAEKNQHPINSTCLLDSSPMRRVIMKTTSKCWLNEKVCTGHQYSTGLYQAKYCISDR